MPPPERIEPDRRHELEERSVEEEMREAVRRRSAAAARAGGVGGFVDRRDAGRQLAEALRGRVTGEAVVLAIPRGGVEVAAPVAAELGAPLDVVIPRKVGAPGNPELGLGAVAEGVEVFDRRLIVALGVSAEYLRAEIERQEGEIRRRTAAYRRGRPAAPIEGRTAVVVDDGVATGGTATAALRWARDRGARRVILAVPVAPADGILRLSREADEVVALLAPEHFQAVGQWYEHFPQVADDRVVELLEAASRGDPPDEPRNHIGEGPAPGR
jgi:putative phosphoribosyl transferase